MQQCGIYMGVSGDALVVLGVWLYLSLWTSSGTIADSGVDIRDGEG